MSSSAGCSSLALHTDDRKESSDDSPACLENPRPAGAESTLTENVASPFHAEPRHLRCFEPCLRLVKPSLGGPACTVQFLGGAAALFAFWSGHLQSLNLAGSFFNGTSALHCLMPMCT